MDARHAYAPSLDEITDMLTSKHPEILSALWNIDKDANPELGEVQGLAEGIRHGRLPVRRHYLFKATILWIDSSTTSLIRRRWVAASSERRSTGTLATQLKNSGKSTGQVGDLIVWNIERVYEEPYTEGTGRVIDVYVETIGQVLREVSGNRTFTQRLKSQGFELVEPRCLGMHKRLQDDQMKERWYDGPCSGTLLGDERWFAFKKIR
jgi:hypothetical protein